MPQEVTIEASQTSMYDHLPPQYASYPNGSLPFKF